MMPGSTEINWASGKLKFHARSEKVMLQDDPSLNFDRVSLWGLRLASPLKWGDIKKLSNSLHQANLFVEAQSELESCHQGKSTGLDDCL